MLLVLLSHAGVGFVPGGYVGVDVFFVLSGFLITGLLLAEARAKSSVSLLEFYLRRARRILPAAALTLLVTDIASFYLLNFVRAQQAVQDSVHAAFFAANFRFASTGVDYFARGDPPSPILHYWSLSVEEQFYLAWPLLLSVAMFGVVALRRRRGTSGSERRLLLVIAVLSAASLAWSIHLTQTTPTVAYFSPFTRAWELGLGATIAVSAPFFARTPDVARTVMGWAGLAAIGVAAVAFSDGTPFPGYAALLPTVGAALAIVAGMGVTRSRPAVGRLLSVRPMLIIGDRSYALYLWHWPILIIAAECAGHALSVTTNLALVAGAFVLSCVSYALVENPIRHRIRRRTTTVLVAGLSMAAVLATATVSLAGIGRAARSFERPAAAPVVSWTVASARPGSGAAGGVLPAVVAAVSAARRGDPIPSPLTPDIGHLKGLGPNYAPPNACIGHDESAKVATAVCRMGDRSSSTLVVLMGDSHAMMWLPAVLETAKHDHWAVIPLLRLGCTPGKWTSNRGGDACRAWYGWALRQVQRLHPSVTLVGGSIDERPTAGTRAAVEGVVTAAQTLVRLGRRTIVIGDPESLGRSPVDCLLSRHATMATCTTTWPPEALTFYDEVARRVTALGAGFLRTRGLVCFEGRCPAVIAHTIVWADDNHLSAAYSAEVAPPFRAAFVAALRSLR